ncbi:hypothetical protein [Enterococcus rivorum]
MIHGIKWLKNTLLPIFLNAKALRIAMNQDEGNESLLNSPYLVKVSRK